MKVILPFVYPTAIDTFSGVAGNVAVQMIDRTYVPLVIYNHFIVTYDKKMNVCGFNWENYNDYYGVFNNIKPLIKESNIIDVFIDTLNRRQYIHTYIDHFYVKGSQFYNDIHFLHDTATIFGYDDMEEVFYVADNFVMGKYTIMEVPFENMIDAVKNNNGNNIDSFYYYNDIDFRLELEHISQIIKGYLDGKCYYSTVDVLNKNTDNDIVYGAGVYAVLINECVKAVDVDYERVDYRTFHIMRNHMQVGELLIEFINTNLIGDKKNIENKYVEMIIEMTTIRNLFIKACVAKKKSVIDTVINKLTQLESEEKIYLQQVMSIIKCI